MKIIYVNCGVKNYLKEDHPSYIRNLCSREKKARKKIVSGFFFCSCISSVYNCDDLPSNNSVNFCFSLCFKFVSIHYHTQKLFLFCVFLY